MPLASSSPKETSIEIDMKHSIFSYFLMKGLKGDAYGDDKILEIGELAEYLYEKFLITLKIWKMDYCKILIYWL